MPDSVIKEIEILAVGGAYVDINSAEFPFDHTGMTLEQEFVGSHYEIVAGGSSLNFLRVCGNLGLTTAFVGKTGRDILADVLDRLVSDSGIKPKLIAGDGVQTNISRNFVNPDGDVIYTTVGTANQSLSSCEVLEKIEPLLPHTQYLYLSTLFKLKTLLPAFEQLITDAKKTDTKIVIDQGRVVRGVTLDEIALVQQLVRNADYYLPSRDEFQRTWNVTSVEEGLELLAKDSSVTTIVKDGKSGAITLHNGQFVHTPAFDVIPINTVGAGDSFNAGFIAAQQRGDDLISSIRYGCATAGLKISRSTLPTKAEIESFLAKYPPLDDADSATNPTAIG